MSTVKIQAPTIGRVVLYHPHRALDAVAASAEPGALDPALHVVPALVLRHDGNGQVRLAVAGYSGVFTARHHELAPGEPAIGCWCWPPRVVDRLIDVPADPARWARTAVDVGQ